MADFTKTVIKDIAAKSFGHTLDCVLGYSDSGYTMGDDAETFEQNFEEDLVEMGISVTERRIKSIGKEYTKLVEGFIAHTRKRYKKICRYN